MIKRIRYNYSLILFLILGVGAVSPSAYAGNNPNTITFENQSGEPAVVRLVGPSGRSVEVPQGETRTINVVAGEFYILVRYGSKAGQYTYSKGDPFTVKQTVTQYSDISITLHKVVGGNYSTHPTSRDEFEQVTANGKAAEKPSTMTSLKEPFTMDTPLVGSVAPLSFAITDEEFIDQSVPNGYDSHVAIKEGEGDGVILSTPPERDSWKLGVYNGKQVLFSNGSTHTWLGKTKMFNYVFDSEKDNPLQFRVERGKGYVYIKGIGTVTTPDGKLIRLPLTGHPFADHVQGDTPSVGVMKVEVDSGVLELLKKWDPNIWFFTPADKPVGSLEGLGSKDFACWGIEHFGQMRNLFNLLAIEDEGIGLLSDIPYNEEPDKPRVYVTWAKYAPRLKNTVRIEFIEKK